LKTNKEDLTMKLLENYSKGVSTWGIDVKTQQIKRLKNGIICRKLLEKL